MSTQTRTRQRWTRQASSRQKQSSTAALQLGTSPLALRYRAGGPLHSRTYRFREAARRILNVIVAGVGIVLTMPLMLMVGLAIKLSSRGPVVFTQQRVGIDRRRDEDTSRLNQRRVVNRGGRVFTMYKFRTMKPSDPDAKQVWASTNDPRITAIGRFLRATRLDELPQLFNVLLGDMNIVGPRPEQPAIFETLSDEVVRYRSRQRVLPGITGLAQVTVGYDTDIQGVKKKVALDLEYIRKRSAGQDLLIMARTLPVMIFRKVWM